MSRPGSAETPDGGHQPGEGPPAPATPGGQPPETARQTATQHGAAPPNPSAAPSDQQPEPPNAPQPQTERGRRASPQQRRVRVTSPQTRIALARRHRPVQHLLPTTDPYPDHAALDAARTAFTQQRRLAIRTLCLLGTLLLGISGLIALLPQLQQVTVAGLPVAWLLLLGGSYPPLLLFGAVHVRAAERAEAHHADHTAAAQPAAASAGATQPAPDGAITADGAAAVAAAGTAAGPNGPTRGARTSVPLPNREPSPDWQP